jgi:hypothetical protein
MVPTHITCPHCCCVLSNDPAVQSHVVACPFCAKRFQMPALAALTPSPPPLPGAPTAWQPTTTLTPSSVSQPVRANAVADRRKSMVPLIIALSVAASFLVVGGLITLLGGHSLAPAELPNKQSDERLSKVQRRSQGTSDYNVTTSNRTLKEIIDEMRGHPSFGRSHYTVTEFFGKFGEPTGRVEYVRYDFTDSSKAWQWYYIRDTGDRDKRGTISLDAVVDEDECVHLEKSKFQVDPNIESKKEESERLEKTAKTRAEKILASEEQSAQAVLRADSGWNYDGDDPALARELKKLRAYLITASGRDTGIRMRAPPAVVESSSCGN